MTYFDYMVIAVILLSALVGWWRGFMYELFSLIGWMAAYLVAHAYAAQLLPYVPPAMGTGHMRAAAAFAALFIATLIVAAVLAWLLARIAKFAGLSGVDSKLGAMFGLLRGMLVVLALVWLGGLTELPRQPWWRDAMSSRALLEAAQYAKDYLPDDAAGK